MARSGSVAEAVAVRDSARLMFSADEVAVAIDRMAARVSEAVSTSCPTVLAIMRGGVFTATQLCSRMRYPYRFDYVHATRYGDGLAGGELSWPVPPSKALAGQTVVVVDDILDRGVTLGNLQARLVDIGAGRIVSAVLVSKRLDPPVDRPRVDVVGLEVEDHYVFGCGMDYKGFWRGLPALYAVGGS